MAFTGEDKVLEEDVIKRDRPFTPTMLEWVADGNAEQVVGHIDGGGNIFVVPDKSTLFLTTIFIQSEDNNVAVGGDAEMVVIMPDDSVRFILGGINTTATGAAANVLSISFPMPIKVNDKERIAITGLIPGAFSAGFTGFILPKRLGQRTFI